MFRRLGPLVGLLAALCAVAAFAVASADAAHSTRAAAKSASAAVDIGILGRLNQIRAAHHLAPLRLSPNLSAAARLHSRDMLHHGYFAHTSADGQVFWKRIAGFYSASHFGYWSVGENLFWTTGSASATSSVRAWMESPPHRANILDPAWRQIGISSITSPDAPGTFGNTDATVITTDFGVRR